MRLYDDIVMYGVGQVSTTQLVAACIIVFLAFQSIIVSFGFGKAFANR